MLKDYPMYFDDTQIPWPTGWDVKYENIQTVNQTEAGLDVVDTTRWHKMEVGAKFLCSAEWAKTFEEFSTGSFILKFYHEIDEDYAEIRVRMEKFKMKFKKHSEKVRATNGIWEVSFDLVQF